MAKPKQSTRQRSWKKYILVGLVALVVASPLGYWGYQKYLDKVDANRFATLRADFKKVQTEFNKIDAGWEYHEGCTAGGQVDDFKTCSVELQNESIMTDDPAPKLDAYAHLLVNKRFMAGVTKKKVTSL